MCINLPFLLALTDVFTPGNVFKILIQKEFVQLCEVTLFMFSLRIFSALRKEDIH